MRVIVASLRFAPGHIAHLRAYRELFSSIGCDVKLYLENGYNGFIEEDQNVVFYKSTDEILEWKPDMVLSYNIANENIKVAKQCKRSRIPFYYVLHEPWDSFKAFLSLKSRMPRRFMANIVNYLTAHFAYKVVFASENGKQKFLKYMKICNKNYAVFPLIFCDDYDDTININRKYFSFIGGFTETRACEEFLSFIKYSMGKKLNIKFCIATRNSMDSYLNDHLIRSALDEGRLTVHAGQPMKSDEINLHYREAICAWNAYKISTQSGVLPNALMQGAPVLVTDRGDSKSIVTEKKEGCFISLPLKNEAIEEAYTYISSNVDKMSEAARYAFHNNYEYKIYLDKARTVYEIM